MSHEYHIPEFNMISCSTQELTIYEHAAHWRLPLFYLQYMTIYEGLWLINLIGMFRKLVKEKHPSVEKDGWFYLTQNTVNRNIPELSPRMQTDIIKGLKDKDVLQVDKRGLPAKNYYRINHNILVKWANEYELSKKQDSNENPNDSHSPTGRVEQVQLPAGVNNVVNNNVVNDITKEDKSSFKESSTPLEKDLKNTSIRSLDKEESIEEDKEESIEEDKEESIEKSSSILNRRTKAEIIRYKLAKPKKKEIFEILPNTTHFFTKWKQQSYKDVKTNAIIKLKQRGQGTKENYEASKKLLTLKKGKLFNKNPKYSKYHNVMFTDEQILQSFENFSLAALDPAYHPVNKKYYQSVTLSAFLYSYKGESLFLQYLQEPPLIKVDNHPQVTERLINFYTKEVLKGVGTQIIQPAIKVRFIEGAERLMQFYKKVRSTLPAYYTYAQFMDDFIKCIIDKYQDFNITVGHITNDSAIQAFTAFLAKEDLLKERVLSLSEMSEIARGKTAEKELADRQREVEHYDDDEFTDQYLHTFAKPWQTQEIQL